MPTCASFAVWALRKCARVVAVSLSVGGTANVICKKRIAPKWVVKRSVPSTCSDCRPCA